MITDNPKFQLGDTVKVVRGIGQDTRTFQVMMYPPKSAQQYKEDSELHYNKPVFLLPLRGGTMCMAEEEWLEKV